MKNWRLYLFIGVLQGVSIGMLKAQLQTKIYDPSIKTLGVEYAEKTNLMRPYLVIDKGEIDGSELSNTLLISFDQMSHDIHQYSYTVVQLNEDDTESSLVSSYYLRGFTTQDITNYETSLNTSREYTHYWFTFPNEDMILTASGKYQLRIYENGDRSQVVASINIAVVDPKVEVTTAVRPNTQIEFNGRYQQIDIDVVIDALDLRDPNELKIIVQQNGRSDNQVELSNPTYVEGKRLRYMNQRALIFEGGNEYHHFDAFSQYMAGYNIDRIEYDHNDYHAILVPEPVRGQGAKIAGEIVNDKTGTQYIHESDANGQFVVNAERTENVQTEAEYMWVHWTLLTEQPWMDGLVYIGGDLFSNTCTAANRMAYDVDHRCYYLSALVKQGGYDYQYWFVEKGKKEASVLRTEGSHWQTENEYTVLVYYHPFGSQYDQLIGIQQTKSR